MPFRYILCLVLLLRIATQGVGAPREKCRASPHETFRSSPNRRQLPKTHETCPQCPTLYHIWTRMAIHRRYLAELMCNSPHESFSHLPEKNMKKNTDKFSCQFTSVPSHTATKDISLACQTIRSIHGQSLMPFEHVGCVSWSFQTASFFGRPPKNICPATPLEELQ